MKFKPDKVCKVSNMGDANSWHQFHSYYHVKQYSLTRMMIGSLFMKIQPAYLDNFFSPMKGALSISSIASKLLWLVHLLSSHQNILLVCFWIIFILNSPKYTSILFMHYKLSKRWKIEEISCKFISFLITNYILLPVFGCGFDCIFYICLFKPIYINQ